MISIEYRKPYRGNRYAGCTKYPWKALEIGEFFDVLNGNAVNISNQASAAGRRYRRHFRTQSGFPGNAVRVWRIARAGHVPHATSRPYTP